MFRFAPQSFIFHNRKTTKSRGLSNTAQLLAQPYPGHLPIHVQEAIVSLPSTSSSMKLHWFTGAVLATAIATGAHAQDSTTPAAPAAAPAAQAPAAAPAPAPDPKPWRVGPMDVSGFLDGYYSYNSNDPSEDNNGKINDL